VVRKDGLVLIRELAAEVKNMIDIKINTVMVSIDAGSSQLDYLWASCHPVIMVNRIE
jgi:hypothetical protein